MVATVSSVQDEERKCTKKAAFRSGEDFRLWRVSLERELEPRGDIPLSFGSWEREKL